MQAQPTCQDLWRALTLSLNPCSSARCSPRNLDQQAVIHAVLPNLGTASTYITMQASMVSMRSSGSFRLCMTSSKRSSLAGLPLAPKPQQQQQHLQPAAAASSASRSRRSAVTVQARYRGSSPDLAERVLAAVPYLLPFLDSLGYGRFLFFQYPMITRAIAPLAPLISVYSTVPFAPFVAFFAVYLGIINNQRWPRFVRFNAMQAVLLDILLILPRLVEQVFSTPTGGWALQAYIIVQNTIWIFVAAAVLYGIGASLTGQAARIPLVADAAEQQVR